jgi:putative hemolysin
MMLEAMVEEATSATAEAYAASRKYSAPSSSSIRTRLPVFSASNPFGRVPKVIAPAPSSSSSSSSSSSFSSSSCAVSSAPAEDTDYPSKDDKFEYQKTVDVPEKKTRESKVRGNQESECIHDCITGLPDMHLVRDHDQSKDQTESPYNNCQGVFEKVSVLLKLFQTHTDDVPSEKEETSDLFVMPEMTPAFVSMTRRSNTPVDHSNQPSALSPLTIIIPDADGDRRVSGVIAMTDDIYQESDSTDPILAVKTPMRSMKAPTLSPDLATKLAECSLNRSPRVSPLSSGREYYLSPETREGLVRTDSGDQISPLSACSHTIHESSLPVLSPLELPALEVKVDCSTPTASPRSGTCYTPGGRLVTVTDSGKKGSAVSTKPNRMFNARGRGDSFKTPPPASKSDYSVSRSDVDRLRGLLCVPLNTDRGPSDRNDSTEAAAAGGGGGSSISRSLSTNSPGSMSACRAAVSRVIAPTATRRGGIIGWVGPSGFISDTTECAKSLILEGPTSLMMETGRVQKEGRMRRSIGSRDFSSNDVSPISTTPTGLEEERDGRECMVSTRTYNVGFNSAEFESSSEIMRTYAVEAVMSNIETAEEAEKRAAYRLGIRCQIAKWKYHWELASYQAAKVARLLSRESF